MVSRCFLTYILCSVYMGRQTQTRYATESFTLPHPQPRIRMGTLKTMWPKTTLAGLWAWTKNQITLALVYRRLSSQAKSECSLTNERILAFCYIITGWGGACCLVWVFGQQPLLIFHTKSWQLSSGSFAKCLFATFLCFVKFSFFPLFTALQWVWWVIVSYELTVSYNCYQTFHYLFKLNQMAES